MTTGNNPSENLFAITNTDEVNSPALLVYPDRIGENIKRLISIAGDSNLLRPHVKTVKTPEIVGLEVKQGIRKFKCATIAEAEMAAGAGAEDIMLAYQPVGPNIRRFFKLKGTYPGINFSCITDSEKVIGQLSEYSVQYKTTAPVWLDINVGMNRTGIEPGKEAVRLYNLIRSLPGLNAEGLHVYDGHIHENDPAIREKMCNKAFLPVESLIQELSDSGESIKVVAGGTPTFPIHAARKGVETSPGTAILWDYGYSSSFADLDFLHAAVLFSRVISKPEFNLICIDLGTKAVASEMPHPRVKITGLANYEFVSHNEEHMVIRTSEASKISIGDVFYCIPYHICPTVDRYDKVSVVRNGKVTEQWNVEARKREITV
ncbi:MAG: threonine aldolase [Bacteroidetes bacterium RBG_13_42_15]|nr:MAG: threonine aldolase [Bacteroidetes bacterium RBG_13_42_15]